MVIFGGLLLTLHYLGMYLWALVVVCGSASALAPASASASWTRTRRPRGAPPLMSATVSQKKPGRPLISGSAEEAGHLLGFDDASHEFSTLQTINAKQAGLADLASDADIAGLEAKIAAVGAARGCFNVTFQL